MFQNRNPWNIPVCDWDDDEIALVFEVLKHRIVVGAGREQCRKCTGFLFTPSKTRPLVQQAALGVEIGQQTDTGISEVKVGTVVRLIMAGGFWRQRLSLRALLCPVLFGILSASVPRFERQFWRGWRSSGR
jgi:hypothetical protein